MTPAATGAAVTVGVLVALESLEDIVAIAIPGLARQSRRGIRAAAAAAEKQDQRFAIDLAHQFGGEIGVPPTARVEVPLDLDSAGNAAHPVLFGAGAHVDQPGAGRQAQEVEGFLRRQRAFVRQAHGLGPLLREGEDLR